MNHKSSPALIISIVALFVALGGTSYAAVKVNGKNIKKSTIAGNKLKKNTLTGTQIKESKLGKVPSAVNADRAGSAATADNATSAATLAGIAPGALVKGSGNVITRNRTFAASSSGTIIEIPGHVRLIGICNSGNDLQLRVESAATAVTTRISVVSGSTVTSTGGTYGAGEGFNTAGYLAQHKFSLSTWRSATPDVAYEINGATVSCNTSAVAVGNG